MAVVSDTGVMELLVGAAIVAGVVGVIVPILPGVLLVAGAIGVWAVANDAWWLLVAVALLTGVAVVAKYLIPARTARDAASTLALAIGAVAALIGFFVLPVIGMVVGFLGAVLLTELLRLGSPRQAWRATWATAKSIGLTIAVELVASIGMAGLWVAALVAR